MKPSAPILIFDLDALFRQRLRNSLRAAGYQEVDVTATEAEALAKLTRGNYRCVLVGLPPLSSGAREKPTLKRPNGQAMPVTNSSGDPLTSVFRDKMKSVVY